MRSSNSKQIRKGVGQLTLVEHALCPLDARVSLAGNLTHKTSFRYTDKRGKRQTGNSTVTCPHGLSPKDELVLWGLLGITLADPACDGELHATRHYCLRRLGEIDAGARRGGRQYRDFSASLERLASIRYQCDAFYDPIRGEHRRVSFGFFSYSLPLDDKSSRAWRIAWDPIFFDFVKAAGGSLRFDLETYRELDGASRRIYLFLSKLFYRRSVTPRIHINDFAEQVMGIAPTVSVRDKKAKLSRCIRRLTACGVVREGAITKISKGRYVMVLHRGPLFDRSARSTEIESPMVEPLVELGFDIRGANRLLRRFDTKLVRQWVDITLAAKERNGPGFFRRSAAAFLTDNLKHAAAGRRTPPDWWGELRKVEERKRFESDARRHVRKATAEAKVKPSISRDTKSSIVTTSIDGMDALDGISRKIFTQFLAAGQTASKAESNAKQFDRELRRMKIRNENSS